MWISQPHAGGQEAEPQRKCAATSLPVSVALEIEPRGPPPPARTWVSQNPYLVPQFPHLPVGLLTVLTSQGSH